MNAHQIALVQQSFEQVIPRAAETSKLFYLQLFAFDPSLKALFKGDMAEQEKKLIQSLEMVVKSLTEVNKILPSIQEMAIRHVDYGVKPEHYITVGNALLVALKKTLGNDFTPEIRAAWVEAYLLLSRTMCEAAYSPA